MSAPNLNLLLGQRIVGAILKEGEGPASQMFLIFEDGTHTEFYSDDRIRVSAGWPGGVERARAYMASTHKITHEAYVPTTAQAESGETMPSVLTAGAPSSQPDLPPIPAGARKAEFLAIWRADLGPSLKN